MFFLLNKSERNKEPFEFRKFKKLEKVNSCFIRLDLIKLKNILSNSRLLKLSFQNNPRNFDILNSETLVIYSVNDCFSLINKLKKTNEKLKKNCTFLFYKPTKILSFSESVFDYLSISFKQSYWFFLNFLIKDKKLFPFFLKDKQVTNPEFIILENKITNSKISSLLIHQEEIRFFPPYSLFLMLLKLKPGSLRIVYKKNLTLLSFEVELGVFSSCPVFIKKKNILSVFKNKEGEPKIF